MTMCRVELKDLQKAIENHAAFLKDADERLNIALTQYKANYKYSLWEKITGVTKLSTRSLCIVTMTVTGTVMQWRVW